MSRKRKIIGGILLLLFLCIAGVFIYLKAVIPPGEEWIAYNSGKITADIDRQLEDLDIDTLISEKESLVLEKNIDELQQAVGQGKLTYEELAAICLYRIKTLDQSRHGYNSVTEVAVDVLEQARACDTARSALLQSGIQFPPSPLFGIPVLLKDNINTADIPTSAGAEAFSTFLPREDAALVRTLREQGAVILGKNNLSEFANYLSSVMPSGYSGKAGQTVNPFGPLKISPSGSSSGSAVSVTANLAPVSFGTETAGSISGPAAANSVVGFKPSRGSISAEGIMPLIQAVDTPGPIAKCVSDASLAYGALSGSYADLSGQEDALNGAVIGLLTYDYNQEDMIPQLKTALEHAGAQVKELPGIQDVSVQNIIYLTFRRDFEAYALKYGLPITTLKELIAYNQEDSRRRIRYGQDLLEAADGVEQCDDGPIKGSIQEAQEILDSLFSEHGLDAVVFLNSTASATVSAAGYPQLTVPLGMDKKGVPQGATFAAEYGRERKLLELGYSFEQNVQGRFRP